MKPNVYFRHQAKNIFFFCVILTCACHVTYAQKFEPNYNIPGQNIVYDMASNSKFVFASTGGSGLFRSGDEGATWQDITGSTGGGYFYSLLSAQDSLYTGSFGSVFFSSDNGTTWKDLGLGLDLNDNVLALAKNSQFVFAGIEQKGVFSRSHSGGAWVQKNTGLHSSATVNDLLTMGSALFAATDKGLYVSGNNGTSWTLVTAGLTATISVNKLYKKNNLVIAGASNGFYKSTDSGNSWTFSGEGGAPVTPNIVSLTSLGNVYFGGAVSSSLHGAFLSFDQGSTWTTYTANAAAAMPYYSLTSSKNFVFAGIGNSILRYSPGPVGLLEKGSDNDPVRIFPNPCSDKLFFSFPQSTEPLMVEVYDVNGRKVLMSESQDQINVGALSPGLYDVVVRHPEGLSSLKFIKE
jgi:hypothetical protein